MLSALALVASLSIVLGTLLVHVLLHIGDLAKWDEHSSYRSSPA